jgi:signal transduction histidine kinase
VHVIAQVENITDRKRFEGSIASARDEALEASRLKSEFLVAMIDEVRTPTNEVIGLTRLLRDTRLTPAQADYVRTLEAAGDALLTIINDILDYSKIAAGQVQLESAPFNLRACVDEAIALFLDRAAQKNINLQATVAARVPSHAAGDAKRLRQILVNLLNNAIKFADTGEVRVNLTAEALDPAARRQRLKFAVRDTGPGIPEDNMEPVFASFAHVDASTRQLGGTGLGLAISKRLAELMGGTMWVQREPGRGSTFHFTVVVEPLEEPASA